jgi:hypothetical protein
MMLGPDPDIIMWPLAMTAISPNMDFRNIWPKQETVGTIL